MDNLKIDDFTTEAEPLVFELLYDNHCIPTDGLLISCLEECVMILSVLLPVYQTSVAIFELYKPLVDILDSIPENSSIHSTLKQSVGKWNLILEGINLKRRPLQLQARKALAIKTYNPKFQQGYSVDRKSYDPDREMREARKLKAEYKKEMKGAIRELRSDAAADSRTKIANIKRKDTEYKKKMDKIKGNLADQEGSMRGFEREAKKAKLKSSKAKG